MAIYKVLSDNCGLGVKDSLVDSEKCEECNIEALVVGGHLAEVTSKSNKETEK
jgi:hypothetical protein